MISGLGQLGFAVNRPGVELSMESNVCGFAKESQRFRWWDIKESRKMDVERASVWRAGCMDLQKEINGFKGGTARNRAKLT